MCEICIEDCEYCVEFSYKNVRTVHSPLGLCELSCPADKVVPGMP